MAALHRPALPAPRILGKVRSGRLYLYLAGALLVLVALVQVNEFSRLTSTGYEVDALRRERDLQLAENHRLEAEVARLSSLARVDWEARTRLKMEPPKRRLYLEVNRPVPDEQSLPARFRPEEAPAHSNRGEPWWERVARWLIPF